MYYQKKLSNINKKMLNLKMLIPLFIYNPFLKFNMYYVKLINSFNWHPPEINQSYSIVKYSVKQQSH